MILDSIDCFAIYAGMNGRFEKVLDFFRHNDLAIMPDGRYQIEGNSIYMVLGENTLKNESEAMLEVHDRYIDIQYVLRGQESFGWRNRAECSSPQGKMDPERDILFFNDRPSTLLSVTAGQFVIFFPHDAHAPLIGEGRDRKCIIKVQTE